MHRARSLFVLALWAALVSTSARAQPSDVPPVAVPPALAPWIPWVLDGVGDARCPVVASAHVCVWPSMLALEVEGKSASFELRLTSERDDAPVELPGAPAHWPVEVALDNKPVPVLEAGGRPQIRVARGEHTVRGRFSFVERPAALSVPARTGTLSLRVDDKVIAHPRREDSGLVWIDESERAEAREARLTLSVHRRIEDAVPLRVITRIEVSAAGQARELVLPQVLLASTRPTALRTDLPAQLMPDGRLRLQVQAGNYRIEIAAIAEQPFVELRARTLPAPWPEQEVWVFQADDQLRHVELTGPAQIDPARTDLAADWRSLPTFLVAAEAPLRFDVRRRGEADPPPNRLTVERALWLDLDGDGYTVRDHLHGALRRDFRLDLRAGALGHAVVDGIDALITRHGEHAGVELRRGALDLTTEWRLEHGRRSIAAVGYDQSVEALSAQLHLPPGFTLLGVGGADAARGTWFDRWDLFDFFFVLLCALATSKLAGRGAGLLALIALLLTTHEPSAPGTTWIILLVATALTRALAQNKLAKLTQVVWLIALVLLLLDLLPFATAQLRTALHPQLARTEAVESRTYFEPLTQKAAPEEEVAVPMDMLQESADEGGGGRRDAAFAGSAGLARSAAPGSPAPKKSYALRDLLDPNAIVQTGPGLPNWQFQSHALQWSGPVAADQQLTLWLLPPWATRLWALASTLLSFALLALLARARGKPPGSATPEPSAPGDEPSSETMVTLAFALSLIVTSGAQAQHGDDAPPSAMLDELRARLVRPPACGPVCSAIPTMVLATSPSRLEATFEVHAGERAIVRLPGPVAQWPVDSLRLDKKDALPAARLEDGFLYVRVPPGIHQIVVSGATPPQRAFTLALGAPKPHRVIARGGGWVVEGLRADGTAEDTIALRPAVARGSARTGEQALTQWFEVRRELELGLRFRVQTQVTRLGPASESVLVRLPLLPGESVTEAGLESLDGSVVVTLPRDQQTVRFSSSLDPRDTLALRAEEPLLDGQLQHPYSEVWSVRPSPLYRVTFEGIAPITQRDGDDQFAPLYRPWPGETLTIHAQRLEPAAGASVTIDRAELRYTPGSRLEQSTLAITVRASRGTTERIRLPAEATLASLEIDGRPHPARLKQSVLEIPLGPGSHAIALTMNRPSALGFHYKPRAPSVARPLTNVLINVTLPNDRWLLATAGPAWGPAVLFWGYLLLVVLVGVGLGRVTWSPLKTYQWILLGLGLTQVDAFVALIVVGWLFALAAREHHPARGRNMFNFLQILLVGFTLGALCCLAHAVHQGLLLPPDMQVQGMMSNRNFVQWYADRTAGDLPEISIWSAPLWIYKCLMLIWALWLAASLVQWLRWGWTVFRKDGGFRPKPPGLRRTRAAPAPGGSSPPSSSAPDSERARVS